MNKDQLISILVKSRGISKAQASRTVDAILGVVTDSLAQGQDVRMPGFGTITVTRRAASKARNPRTGQVMQVPSRLQPRFKASKRLKAGLQSDPYAERMASLHGNPTTPVIPGGLGREGGISRRRGKLPESET